MATSEQPDLILMDVTLPDIDGEEATRFPPLSKIRFSDYDATS